ncbi:MAG: hypothetical protein NVS2B16_31970 [Chloroflexota bacterium]
MYVRRVYVVQRVTEPMHPALALQWIPADDLEAAEAFQVYADPAGHPFCIGRH